MARLRKINYEPHHDDIHVNRVELMRGFGVPTITGLPQISWNGGEQWIEANLWALDKALSGRVKLKTVQSLMGHLHKYAEWLEEEQVDWRHFPDRRSDSVLYRFRGALMAARNEGVISQSTATARMRAVIAFYKHCEKYSFVNFNASMWTNRVASYYDSFG